MTGHVATVTFAWQSPEAMYSRLFYKGTGKGNQPFNIIKFIEINFILIQEFPDLALLLWKRIINPFARCRIKLAEPSGHEITLFKTVNNVLVGCQTLTPIPQVDLVDGGAGTGS